MNTIFKNDQMESGNFSDMAKGLVDVSYAIYLIYLITYELKFCYNCS